METCEKFVDDGKQILVKSAADTKMWKRWERNTGKGDTYMKENGNEERCRGMVIGQKNERIKEINERKKEVKEGGY